MKKLFNTTLQLSLIAPLATLSSLASAESKISAFADVQYHGQSEDQWNQEGIFLNDGAVYFSHTTEKSEFLLDLPFSSAPVGSATNNLSFAATKAQAYFQYKMDDGCSLRAGQFDTPFGFEAADSKDLHFSAGGLIYGTLPNTHTGLMGIWESGALTVKAILANPYNNGHLEERNPEAALQLSYEAIKDEEPFTAGVLFSSDNGETRTMFDVFGGVSIGESLRLDAEINIVNDSRAEDLNMNYMLFLEHSISEKLALAVRAEYLMKALVDNEAVHSQMGISVGPKYQVSENLALKAQYDFSSNKASEDADSATLHGVRVSGVYSF